TGEWLQSRVFGVNVIGRRAKFADGLHWICTHPEQMARVEIRTHAFADRVAETLQCSDAIDVLMTVQFKTEFLDAMLCPKSDEFLPIRDQDLVPLPAEDFSQLWRPFGCDPVGVAVARRARTARHH